MGKSNKKKHAPSRREAVRRPEYGEVLYDVNGYRVGDDGFPMTPIRKRLHRLFDAVLIFGYISIAIAVVLVVLALFQGQSYTETEFIAYGGKEYAGFSVASLMRGEALVIFVAGLLSIIVNHRGFRWLYDGEDGAMPRYLLVGIGVLTFGWCAFLALNVKLIDPVSCVFIILAILTLKAMSDARTERATLKPSVIAQGKD